MKTADYIPMPLFQGPNMYKILLVLIFITGCSTTKYYRAADLSAELMNNSLQLTTLMESVEHDFSQKETFFQLIDRSKLSKNSFLIQDLGFQMSDLENKKRNFEHQSKNIKIVNDNMLIEVSSKDMISENDPLYAEINHFSSSIEKNSKAMFKALYEYKESAKNLERSIAISKNIWEASLR